MKLNKKWKLLTSTSLILIALLPVSSSIMAVDTKSNPKIELNGSKAKEIGPTSDTTSATVKSAKNTKTVASGTYGTVNWDINDAGELHLSAGTIPVDNSPFAQYASKITKIVLDGNIIAPSHITMFGSLNKVTEIQGLDKLDTSQMTDMSGMFYAMTDLQSIDLSSWDTSNVTNMGSMFANDSSLTSLDLSNFDTSKVTNISAMFIHDENLNTINLSGWNTSNVKDMISTFAYDSSLTSLDLSGFDTSKVTSMSAMFFHSGINKLDLTNFNTSNVTDMGSMFAYDSSLTSLDISSFDTSNVTEMGSMFLGIGTNKLDLTNFNTSNVTNMGTMFYHTKNLNTIDLSSFDTSKVTNMDLMFGNSKFKTLDLSKFKTSSLTEMKSMFANNSLLTTLDISGIDTSKVSDMTDAFAGDNALNTLTLGSSFKFIGGTKAALPEIKKQENYSGKWINLNNGTITEPKGSNILASSELMNNYDGSKDSDTYVWQVTEKSTKPGDSSKPKVSVTTKHTTSKKLPQTSEMNTALISVSGILLLGILASIYTLKKETN